MRVSFLFSCMAAIFPAVLTGACWGRSPDLSEALALLEQRESNLNSCRFRYEFTDQIHHGDAAEKVQNNSQTYRYSFSGRRKRMESTLSLGAATGSYIFTFDGDRDLQHDLSNRSGVVKSGERTWASYAGRAYHNEEGLLALIRPHLDDLREEWIESGSERLLHLAWDQAEGRQVKEIWLNPSADFQPRRIASRWKEYYGEGRFRKKSTLDQRVESYREAGGFFFPSRIVCTIDHEFEDGRRVRDVMGLELTEVEANPVIPDEEFTITFPPGTRIHDADARIHYLVEADGSWTRKGTAAHADNGRVPDVWGAPLWLALAVAFASTAAFLIWRRSRTSA